MKRTTIKAQLATAFLVFTVAGAAVAAPNNYICRGKVKNYIKLATQTEDKVFDELESTGWRPGQL